MRNDDLSQSGNHHPTANDDYDVIPAGSGVTATGNTISGRGTISGAAGADDAGSGGHVTAITGAGADDGSAMEAAGRYGSIKIDAQGNYTYTRNHGSPDNVEDVFTYTLADKSGALDSARLIVRIEGKEEQAKVQDNAQRIVAGNEVITLPAGVELSDIHVVGRDLVIDLPDGTQMVITDGAVFVPQLALGDIEIPSDTLASLLIDSEPRPAAGPPESSGGNFGEPVAPLDPGVPLGDLLPPTELDYTPPEFDETYIPQKPDSPDFPPEIFVQPDGQPASVAAEDNVDEAALNMPPNDHEGSNSASTGEAVSGDIIFSSPDGVDTITISINGTDYVIYGSGAVSSIPGDYGTLVITGVDIDAGTASYTYTLTDNVNHFTDTTPFEDFTVTLVDSDGDPASATLRINIADDIPEAKADADSVTEDGVLIADGNVFTGSGGSDSNLTDGVLDVQGADGAHVTGFTFGSAAGTFGVPLQGTYGELLLASDGTYKYTLHNDDPAVQALKAGETRTEIYHYTITDGDTDTSTTTLTITITGSNDRPVVVSGETAVTEEAFLAPEDNPGNPDGFGNPTDEATSASVSGDLSITDVDGDALTVTLSAPAGSYYSHGELITWTPSDGGHTLTGSTSAGPVIVVTMTNGGHYTVDLLEQIDHPDTGTSPATSEDILDLVVGVHASDGSVTTDGSLTIHVEDDSPIVTGAPVLGAGVDIDETNSTTATLSPAGAITVSSSGAIVSAAVAYGGDGRGGDPVYAISINGAIEGSLDSGLKTADGNHAITLVEVDPTHINGVFNDGGDKVAFSITINTDGSITVTQNYALEHSDDGSSDFSHNDTGSPLDLAGLINATVEYEDYDHDTVSATSGVGQLIRFFDDGPSISVSATKPTDAQALDGLALVTQDDGTEGDGETEDQDSVNLAGLFHSTTDGGSDGEASSSLTFTLDLVGDSVASPGVDSTLDSHGATIYLYQIDGNTIVGSTSDTLAGALLDANLVFDLSTTDGGTVTLTQYQQIDHPLEASPSPGTDAPFDDQYAALPGGLINLVGTGNILDNDGDTDSDNASLDMGGLVRFQDDGPAIDAGFLRGAALVVDESLPGTAAGETEPEDTLGQVSVAISSIIAVSDTAESADAPTTYSYAFDLGEPGEGGLVSSGLYHSAPGNSDQPIYLFLVNGVVYGTTATTAPSGLDGNTVFTVEMNGGNFVLTQYLAVEQNTAPNEYNELSDALASGALMVNVTATDYDGDTDTDPVDLGSIIRFNDDGPSATVAVGGLPTDPAALAAFQLVTNDNGTEGLNSTMDSTTANFGGLFGLIADGGSDGIDTQSLTFDLNLVGAGDGPIDSGLNSHGGNIYLYQIDANTVIGSTSATLAGATSAANLVFQLQTTDGGAVTLTQYQQVDHAVEASPVPGTGAPFNDQPAILDSGLIQVVATGTVTDNDADIATDSETLDLGGLVRFLDDGPAIDATIKAGAALHIDESQPGVDNAPSETDNTGLGQVTVAITDIVNVADTSVSADAPTTYGYALNLGPAGEGGLVNSGLFHSAPGDSDQPIYLFNVGGVVYGTTATSVPGGVDANTVFTIALVGGNVVMTQYGAIENPTAGNTAAAYDENSLPLASGALNLVVTATDYDGDTATDSVDVGAIITFGDDGPTATDRTLPGTQAENDPVVVDVTADINAGSDGFDHVQYLSTTGTGTVDYDVATQVFTYHPGSGESGTVTITYRVFDNDGDWDDATISFSLADSSPVAIAVTASLDDDGLGDGNALSTTGDIDADSASEYGAGVDNEAIWTGMLGVSAGGADTPLTYSLAGMDGEPGMVGTENVTYHWDAGSNTLTATTVGGTRPNTDLFSVQITDTHSGAYQITLLEPIMHAAGGNETSAPDVELTYSVADSDVPADTDEGTITITFNDDAPTADIVLKDNVFVGVDESESAVDVEPFETDTAGGNLGVATVTAAQLFTDNSVYGADGAAATGSAVYSLQVNGLAAAGSSMATTLITSNGNLPITLFKMPDGSIIGSTAATYAGVGAGITVFSVSISASGTVTMTQFVAVEHTTSPNNFDETATQGSIPDTGIQVVLTVKDGDGDTSSDAVNLGSRIQFEDDGPNAGADPSTHPVLTLDESAAGTDNPTPGSSAPVGDRTESTDIASYFAAANYGSDSAGSTTNALVLTLGVGQTQVASGLYALDPTDTVLDGDGIGQGSQIMLEQHGSEIWGVANGQTYFTIGLSGTTLTFTQAANLNLWHPNTGSLDEAAALNLAAGTIKIVHTVTDSDADQDTAVMDLSSGVFSIQDDGPRFVAGTVTGAVGEDALAPDGNPDAGDSKTTSSGALNLSGLVNFGTDGPGMLKFDASAIAANLTSQGLTSGGATIKYAVSADGLTLTGYTGASVGIGNVFTLTLSGTNATFVLLDQIDHSGANLTGSGDDQVKAIDFGGVIRAYDADGDSVALGAGSVKINVEDDLPQDLSATLTAHVDEDELPAGITDGDGFNTVATGSLATLASVGADQPGTFGIDLTGATMPTLTSGGATVSYGISSGGLLVGYTGADVNNAANWVFKVALSGTNSSTYTFTLLKQIDHSGTGLSGTGDNQIKTIDLSNAFTVTDKDGDTIHLDAGSFQVEIEDDIPTTFSPQAATTTNNAAGIVSNAALDFGDAAGLTNNYGADGGKAVFTLTGLPSTQTSGGVALFYTLSNGDQTLTATAGNGGPVVYTATITGSTYTLDIVQPIDSLTEIDFTSGAYDHPGGNPDFYAFYLNGNNDSQDLLITPIQGGVTGGSINLNSNLFGVSSGNDVGAGDAVRLDYVRDLDVSGGSLGDWSFEQHYNVNGATVEMAKATNATVRLIAYDDADGNNTVGDGSIDTINKIVVSYNGGSQIITPTTTDTKYTIGGHDFWVKANGDGTVSVGGVTGDTNGLIPTTIGVYTANGYNSLVMEYQSGPHGTDSFKVGGFGAAVQNTNPVIFDIPVKIVDGDGDETAAVNIHVTLNTPAPPVLLDTNHDGVVSVLGIDTGVLYDMNGDGHLDHTAWVAPGDSILFMDADGNGTVSGANEFVFGGNGVTDLEALHVMYGDQLDSGDSDFTMFGLWNDANSNGVVDGGELSSLAEAGISAISLVSDGVAETAAGGDVSIAGTGTFTYVNDNGEYANGKLADAAFSYRQGMASEEQRIASSSTNASLLAIAAAAAGLAEQAAAGTPSNDASPDAPAVDATPVVTPATAASDSAEPQVSPLLAGGDLQVEASQPAPHHNAVVADDSAPAAESAPVAEEAPALPQGTSLPMVDSTALVDVAPMTVAGEAAAPSAGGAHHNAVIVEQLVSQPETAVEQILAKLGGDATEQLAIVQGGAKAVQGWDMGDFTHLPITAMEHMGAEASLLHPDAVQPVVHG